MNKHDAIHSLQRLYSKFHTCTGPTGAEFDEYKKLANDLGTFINELPDKKEEVTDGDSSST